MGPPPPVKAVVKSLGNWPTVAESKLMVVVLKSCGALGDPQSQVAQPWARIPASKSDAQ
jgi:hypothetical protein